MGEEPKEKRPAGKLGLIKLRLPILCGVKYVQHINLIFRDTPPDGCAVNARRFLCSRRSLLLKVFPHLFGREEIPRVDVSRGLVDLLRSLHLHL
jgi:hypothetical protein